MAQTPTARTLIEGRKRGWDIGVVERWVPIPGSDRDPKGHQIRSDLFGFLDLIAITDDGILGIQATSGEGGNVSARLHKIRDKHAAVAARWIDQGGMIQVWGWKYYQKTVDRRHWRPRIEVYVP